jgi:hypothetical protein
MHSLLYYRIKKPNHLDMQLNIFKKLTDFNYCKKSLQFPRQEKQTHSYARIEDIINQTVYLIKTK